MPHLTHRPGIYEFPQPWVAVTWGVAGEGLPDPNRVEWLILDRKRFFSDSERPLADRLLAGEFVVRYDRDDIVVGQRVRPG